VASTINTPNGLGIWFNNDLPNNLALEHVYIDNVDVSGFKQWGLGIFAQASIGPGAEVAGYRDVRITNSKFSNNQFGGIIIVGSQLPPDYQFHNVYIGHVEVFNNPGLGPDGSGVAGGSGIWLTTIDGGTVERTLAHHNGAQACENNIGIWALYSTNSTVSVMPAG
jgi:hypothetical protein